MKRESLLNLRTCREIVTGMDIARSKQVAPTMFERMRRIIARGTGEVAPHPNEAALAVELDKERRRFKRRFQVVERGAAKILGFRRKLAATHEKHRRIMELRLELQRQYWDSTSPTGPRKKRRRPAAGLAATGTATEEPFSKHRVKRFRYGGKA